MSEQMGRYAEKWKLFLKDSSGSSRKIDTHTLIIFRRVRSL